MKHKIPLMKDPSGNLLKKDKKAFRFSIQSRIPPHRFHKKVKVKVIKISSLYNIDKNVLWRNKKKLVVIVNVLIALNFIVSAFRDNYFVLRTVIVMIVEI